MNKKQNEQMPLVNNQGINQIQ